MAPRAEATGVFLVRLRVPCRAWMCLFSNAPGLVDQLVASQEDSARKRGNVGGKIPEFSAKPYFVGLFSRVR